jgi:hypothetical protein
MGTSYDGTYFYGLLFDHDDAKGWPAETDAVFEAAEVDDFDDWLDEYLGVPAPRTGASYDERIAIREARCLERFGVSGFDEGYLGYFEYPVYYVAPRGARVWAWRGAAVPEFAPTDVEAWRAACEKLAAVLPGASEPGFYFGCSVG